MRKLILTLALLLSPFVSAQAQERLTIYTYESFVTEWGPGPAVKKAFEAECSCTVEWVGVEDGVAILTRLKLEGGASKADLVLGLDQNLVAEAKETGLFAPHGIIAEKLTLPIAWSDDVFLPYDYGHFAVIYDRDKIKVPPKSLD
jgi:thiamine transport system substrate-binding protein